MQNEPKETLKFYNTHTTQAKFSTTTSVFVIPAATKTGKPAKTPLFLASS
jgi:hypothetical protein